MFLVSSTAYSPISKHQLENNRTGINIGLTPKFIIKTESQRRGKADKQVIILHLIWVLLRLRHSCTKLYLWLWLILGQMS
jgi:hypothetical protein